MLPMYTNGSFGRPSAYVTAVATMSWLWIRMRRTGGFRFVTKLPKPSVRNTRGDASPSIFGGSVGGPREGKGMPSANAAAAGAQTVRPSKIRGPRGPEAG